MDLSSSRRDMVLASLMAALPLGLSLGVEARLARRVSYCWVVVPPRGAGSRL